MGFQMKYEMKSSEDTNLGHFVKWGIGWHTNVDNSDNNKIKAYFIEIAKPTDAPYSEYLNIVHDLSGLKKFEDKTKDHRINFVNFSQNEVHYLRFLECPHLIHQRKMGQVTKSEITGPFDSGTFSLNEKPLPSDEMIPTKLEMKTKLKIYDDLHKLKARIFLKGGMQIKDANNKS